jgi:ferredoxin
VSEVSPIYTINFAVSGRTVPCSADSFVLDAGLAAGIKLLFNCREGFCGTCKSTLISGQYDMHHNGGIRPKEIAAGKFLPCCSKPRSDLVVER